ncbi:hypothetical protein AMJ80_06170, partial [bacterium SM23_31]
MNNDVGIAFFGVNLSGKWNGKASKISKEKVMNNAIRNIFITSLLILFLVFLNPHTVSACSTFKLQKGNELIYGHNLNEGDIGVPGLIFINKRGIFKLGRTWSELTTKERLNPSSHC